MTAMINDCEVQEGGGGDGADAEVIEVEEEERGKRKKRKERVGRNERKNNFAVCSQLINHPHLRRPSFIWLLVPGG